ncbi:MAG TPA: hypothetical protein VNO81_09120 [Candidatus Nitrosotenuis sp.]|jgi:hypothetical protein|nr:hypothetical protein [Candidatus Nitrosotenuis sp.]
MDAGDIRSPLQASIDHVRQTREAGRPRLEAAALDAEQVQALGADQVALLRQYTGQMLLDIQTIRSLTGV